MKTRRLPLALVLALVPTGAVLADTSVYDLTGSSSSGGHRTTLTVTTHDGGQIKASRSTSHANGSHSELSGTGQVSANGRRLTISFPVVDVPGFIDVLAEGEARERRVLAIITANYYVGNNGQIGGWISNPSSWQGWSWAVEWGKRTSHSEAPGLGEETPTEAEDPDAPQVQITSPGNDSILLAGQVFTVKTRPRDASIEISGPAQQLEDGRIRLTAKGEVTLTAVAGDERSEPVNITATGFVVEAIEVVETLPLRDARPPHFRQAAEGEEKPHIEAAAILKDRPLSLQVRVRAEQPLSQKAIVTLAGSQGDLRLEGRAKFNSGNASNTVSVTSTEALTDKVAVNEIELAWEVSSGSDDAVAADAKTPLRIYTSYQVAHHNIATGIAKVRTKLHYELACAWANNATANVGNGSESIGWNVDNRMRHHVHPEDFKEGNIPFVSAYPAGAAKPFNYADLPSSWSVGRSGERGISSLYYPPLEPDEDYEKYAHYQANYGWWLLDNPTHTGGRCNQQASLVADILGTLGIDADVHYIERTGISKTTNRPVRQYFYAAGGSGPWNFHGLCKATMADGSEWLYDGSFSSPPNRKNGQREWAEAPGGPFIQKWGPWYYEDSQGGQVPDWDIPDSWRGVGGVASRSAVNDTHGH